MTSLPVNRPLSNKFRELAAKALAVCLVSKKHIDTDTEHKISGITNYWRDVEDLGMLDPPGLALRNKDGGATVIKWPTDKELTTITTKSSSLHHVEFERGGFHYTYAIRTKL